MYQILPDINGDITKWVCHGLGESLDSINSPLTYGFAFRNRMVGGLIFHNIRPHHDVWWTIYSTEKTWCNKSTLKQMFTLAFQDLDCRRISILVSRSNRHCLRFVRRLGFHIEGLLRRFRDNGEDCFVLGMLKEECPWINNRGTKNE